MTIKARTHAVLTVSDLVTLNYSAQLADWDLFEEQGILQRDVKVGHRDSFTELAIKNTKKNPNVTVFDTALVCRLIPKEKMEAKLVAALQKDLKKDWQKYVESCYMIDGQHRAEGVMKVPSEMFSDIKFDVNFVVCDDIDAEGMFFAINGKARKMSPAAVDLALAHQLVNGASLDEKDMARAVASLMVKIFTECEGHPYVGRIEQPFARPPVKSPLLRFHRTVNNTKWLARSYLEGDFGVYGDASTYFSSMEFRFSVTNHTEMMATLWQAIGVVLNEQVFGRDVYYGKGLNRVEAWAHGHLFGILNESIVKHCFEIFNQDRGLQWDLIELIKFIEPALTAFFKDGENDPNMSAGFRGVGGDSPDRQYVEKMKTYLHLCKTEETTVRKSLDELTQKFAA